MSEEPAPQEAKPEPAKEPATETAPSPAEAAKTEQAKKEATHDLRKLAAKKTPKAVPIPNSRKPKADDGDDPAPAAPAKAAKPAKAPKAPKAPKPPKESKADRDAKLEEIRRAAILSEFHGKEVKLKEISHHKWPKELRMAVSTSARVVYRLIAADKIEVTKRGKKSKQAPKGGILTVKVKGK